MTPSEASASYRVMMNAVGETVTIRRYTGSGANPTYFDADVMARVTDYLPHEIVGDIQQADRKIILLAEDMIDAQVPLDLRNGDKVVVRGKVLNIEAADDNTRRIQGVLIAFEIRARG